MRRTTAIALLLIAILCLSGCTSLSEQNAEVQEAALRLGEAYSKQGDYQNALATYEKALESVTSKELLYNRALMLAALQRWEEADIAAADAQKLYPASLVFSTARISFFKAQGLQDKAIEVSYQILELDPCFEAVAVDLLAMLQSQQRQEEARALARTMISRGIGVDKAKAVLLNNL
ncbi:MAG: tetratricopeptide repeat protein [Sphaerochaetaceae bacterium]|jgi:tetratricopeptide (TPR) repeat protein|nr:tetratricopeptide repeat protein [Sphaerochaetaceae bacterium]MDD3163015.1 tetratricopeptide repeat protein [Sphaerochaetaceae bacterium]MDD4007274.1 tetratricopeptide repeat protein [Sphaerochaetaceae bacterium]MDD4396193.1 tetratricopeptide repeat protein [Sphaerochaetaceae bacterium]